MRFILIGFGILVAAMAADVRTGNAQGYNNRWCTDGSGRGNSGVLQCAYQTFEQCRAAARGLNMGCVRNPDFGYGNGDYGRRGGRRY